MKLSFALAYFLTAASPRVVEAAVSGGSKDNHDHDLSYIRHRMMVLSPDQEEGVKNNKQLEVTAAAVGEHREQQNNDDHHNQHRKLALDECLNVRWVKKDFPNVNGNGNMVCTANDVKLGQVKVTDGPTTCTTGEMVTFTADYVLEINRNEAYDIGLFIATGEVPVGGTPSAYDGDECILLGLPFDYSGETSDPPNICGDILTPTRTIEDIELTVPCFPSAGGKLSLPYCTTWAQGSGERCEGLEDIAPGSKSKCNCRDLEVDIRTCDLQITNSFVYESCTSGVLKFETTVEKEASNGAATVTWTVEDEGGNISTKNGRSGSFTGLDAGIYTVTVSASEGTCSATKVLQTQVEVYEPLSVSAELIGGCQGEFEYRSTVTGGRSSGANSYTWEYAGGSGMIFAEDDNGKISPSPTGDIVAELTYSELCGDNCEDPGEECTSPAATANTVVYNPITINAVTVVDPQDTCGGRRNLLLTGKKERRNLQDGPVFVVTVFAEGGPAGLVYSTSSSSNFSCDATGVCDLDLGGVSEECLADEYFVTVEDPSGMCASVDTGAIAAEKTTSYSVTPSN